MKRVIAGMTATQFFSRTMPTVPGLLAFGLFGSGGDGINSNRVAGGPAFANIGNAPALSAGYMTVGRPGVQATATVQVSGGAVTGFTVSNGGSLYTQQPASYTITGGGGSGATVGTATIVGGVITALSVGSAGSGYATPPTIGINGGNLSGVDSGVTRASVLAGGWTTFAIARVPVSGLASLIIGDDVSLTGTGFLMLSSMRNVDGGHSNNPTITTTVGGAGSDFIILPSAATNFRMIAQSYTGGALGTFVDYSVSDNLSATFTAGSSLTTAASQQFHFGPHTNTIDSGVTSDIACAGIAAGVLSSSFLLNTLYPALKSILGDRGVPVI